MAVGKVILNNTEFKSVVEGVLDDCVNLVGHTLGPLGKASLVEQVLGKPQLVDDGRIILSSLGYKDTAKEAVCSLIVNTIEEVNERVGDSSTTNMLLTAGITQLCLEALNKNKVTNPYINPHDLKAGLEKGLELCKEFLTKVTKEVKPDDVYRLAYVSSNSKETASLVADTVSKVGLDGGFIHVTEGKGTATYVEMSGGLEVEAGCASPVILSSKGVRELTLDKPYILIADQAINNAQDIIPILEEVSRSGNPIIIFADKFSNDVLGLLTLNTMRGIFTGIPVQLPLYDRVELLKDLGAISGIGAGIISSVTGFSFTHCNIREGIGIRQIAGAVIYKDKTRLVTTSPEGTYDNSNNTALFARSKDIEMGLEEAVSKGDVLKAESYRKRLASMTGGVATIYVSAPTEVALTYQSEKLKDCISTITSATKQGVIPLASSVMVYMSLFLKDWIRSNDKSEYNEAVLLGVEILSRALEGPLALMVNNRGESFSALYKEFKTLYEEEKWNMGYDILSSKFVDLLEEGKQLIDSSLGLKEVMVSAVSLSSMLMLTEGGTVELPIEEQKVERINMM